MSYSQLDRPVQFLKGVGPKRADAFVKLGVTTARDYQDPRAEEESLAAVFDPILSESE